MAPHLWRHSGAFDDVLAVADVDRALTVAGLRRPAFRLVRDGAVIAPHRYTRHARQGSEDVDDLIDTAGTLVKAAEALIQAGAKSVTACATHAVLSDCAINRIRESPIQEVVLSDSIPLKEEAHGDPKFVTLSVAALLAKAITAIHGETSVSGLFV